MALCRLRPGRRLREFAFGADGVLTALALRFLGGIAVAGVHMPGLKLLIDRSAGAAQGRAAAVYTSSYAAGNAVSFLIAGIVDAAFAAGGIGPLLAIAAAALGAAAHAAQPRAHSSI